MKAISISSSCLSISVLAHGRLRLWDRFAFQVNRFYPSDAYFVWIGRGEDCSGLQRDLGSRFDRPEVDSRFDGEYRFDSERIDGNLRDHFPFDYAILECNEFHICCFFPF